MSKFEAQITPLHRASSAFTEASFTPIDQFSDLEVVHPLNDGKSATVVVPITSSVLSGLEPYAFGLRILYEDRREPVFWGPANIITDFTAGTCTLEGQDPSLRMAHHYLRRGDPAIEQTPVETDKGEILTDHTGIALAVDAAQNVGAQVTRDDPILGLRTFNYTGVAGVPIIVERGQECWQVVVDIAKHIMGPDFDMETAWSADEDAYAWVGTYSDLGTNRTSATPDAPLGGEVVLDYGLGADNLVGVQERPGRPTTHAHVLSGDARYRRSAGDTAASNTTGVYVDWVPLDFNIRNANDAALKQVADARVEAYGVPPKFLEVQLRPDAVIGYSYGHPNFSRPVGSRAPTHYLGDRVTVRAQRGYRDYNGPARIVEVRLTQPGPQGPAVTQLKLVPTVGGTDLGEEA